MEIHHLAHKRPVLLLEVMIAFALIALAAIPLISPHVFLIKAQRHFALKVELDHVVSLLYVDVLEKLYQNRISLSSLTQGVRFDITEEDYRRLGYSGLPFRGSYHFKKEHQKPKREAPYTLYHFKLNYDFEMKNEKGPPLIYHYDVFVVRDIGQGELPEGDSEEDSDD